MGSIEQRISVAFLGLMRGEQVMQLKIQRSQRMGGLTASIVIFCLDVRADYSAEERGNINRYKLGGQTIYNSRAAQRHLEQSDAHLARTQEGSTGNRLVGVVRGAASLAMAKMQLNITIASLGRGHHIECKDLEELLGAEDTVRSACKDLTRYLQVAETFDGSELVVEYVNGEERIHVTPHAPPLLEYAGATASTTTPRPGAIEYASDIPGVDLGKMLAEFWDSPRNRKIVFWGLGILAIGLLLHSCFG